MNAAASIPTGPCLCNVSCGKCGHVADLGEFCSAPVAGEFAPGEYQCPKCHHAWRIVPGKTVLTRFGYMINEPNKVVPNQTRF